MYLIVRHYDEVGLFEITDLSEILSKDVEMNENIIPIREIEVQIELKNNSQTVI